MKCFKIPVVNQDKNWVPHYACNNCSTFLNRWKQGNVLAVSFKEPIKWRKLKNHEDCYFCKTNVIGYNRRNRDSILYARVSSVTFSTLKDSMNVEENAS